MKGKILRKLLTGVLAAVMIFTSIPGTDFNVIGAVEAWADTDTDDAADVVMSDNAAESGKLNVVLNGRTISDKNDITTASDNDVGKILGSITWEFTNNGTAVSDKLTDGSDQYTEVLDFSGLDVGDKYSVTAGYSVIAKKADNNGFETVAKTATMPVGVEAATIEINDDRELEDYTITASNTEDCKPIGIINATDNSSGKTVATLKWAHDITPDNVVEARADVKISAITKTKIKGNGTINEKKEVTSVTYETGYSDGNMVFNESGHDYMASNVKLTNGDSIILSATNDTAKSDRDTNVTISQLGTVDSGTGVSAWMISSAKNSVDITDSDFGDGDENRITQGKIVTVSSGEIGYIKVKFDTGYDFYIEGNNALSINIEKFTDKADPTSETGYEYYYVIPNNLATDEICLKARAVNYGTGFEFTAKDYISEVKLLQGNSEPGSEQLEGAENYINSPEAGPKVSVDEGDVYVFVKPAPGYEPSSACYFSYGNTIVDYLAFTESTLNPGYYFVVIDKSELDHITIHLSMKVNSSVPTYSVFFDADEHGAYVDADSLTDENTKYIKGGKILIPKIIWDSKNGYRYENDEWIVYQGSVEEGNEIAHTVSTDDVSYYLEISDVSSIKEDTTEFHAVPKGSPIQYQFYNLDGGEKIQYKAQYPDGREITEDGFNELKLFMKTGTYPDGTLTFDDNNRGKNVVTPAVCSVSAGGEEFTRDGFNFLGWRPVDDTKGTPKKSFAPDEFIGSVPTEDDGIGWIYLAPIFEKTGWYTLTNEKYEDGVYGKTDDKVNIGEEIDLWKLAASGNFVEISDGKVVGKTNKGLTFKGWSYNGNKILLSDYADAYAEDSSAEWKFAFDKDDLTAKTDINGEVYYSLELKAILETKTFTMKFNKNGGTGTELEDMTFSVSDEINAPESLATPPGGYTFAGWVDQKYYSTKKANKVSAVSQDAIYRKGERLPLADLADLAAENDGVVNMYAVYGKKDTYKVVYDPGYYDRITSGNNGTQSTVFTKVNGRTIEKDYSNDLQTNALSCEEAGAEWAVEGYYISGWNTKVNSDATSYSGTNLDEGSMIKSSDAADGLITLYAVWSPRKYDITYVLDDVSPAVTIDTISYDDRNLRTEMLKNAAKIPKSGTDPEDGIYKKALAAGKTFAGEFAVTAKGSAVFTVAEEANGGYDVVDYSVYGLPGTQYEDNYTVTLYPIYEANDVEIRFYNGYAVGTGDYAGKPVPEANAAYMSQTVTVDGEDTLRSISDLKYTVTGKSFVGWIIEDTDISNGVSATGLVDDGAKIVKDTGTTVDDLISRISTAAAKAAGSRVVNLYAHWSTTKTVNYHLNLAEVSNGKAASGVEEDITLSMGQDALIRSKGFKDGDVVGYKLKGYYVYPNVEAKKKAAKNSNATLDDNNLLYLTERIISEPFPVKVPPDSVSDAITDTKRGLGKVLETTSSVDLYAVWEPDEIFIKFDMSDADGMAASLKTLSDTFGNTVKIPASYFKAKKKGYRLEGFSLTAGGSAEFTADSDSIESASYIESFDDKKTLTLYPVWQTSIWKISFTSAEAGGNTVTGDVADLTGNYSDGMIPCTAYEGFVSDATKGYSFAGWVPVVDGKKVDLGAANPYGYDSVNKKALNVLANRIITEHGVTADDDGVYSFGLEAQWTPAEYKITYVNGGAELVDGANDDANHTFTVETYTSQIFKKHGDNLNVTSLGYVLENWYYDDDYTKPAGNGFEMGTVTEDITVYAHIVPAVFKVVYDTQISDQTIDTYTGLSGEKLQLPEITFGNGTKTFLGWSATGNNTVADYRDRETITLDLETIRSIKSANFKGGGTETDPYTLTLTAVWSDPKGTYKAILDTDNGDFDFTDEAVIALQASPYMLALEDELVGGIYGLNYKYGEALTLPAVKFTDGDFDHWEDADTGEVLEGNVIAAGSAGKKSYIAVRKTYNYTIRYDKNSSDANIMGKMADSSHNTAVAAVVESNGYDGGNYYNFAGWALTPDMDTTATRFGYAGDKLFNTGDELTKLRISTEGTEVTLYAQWTRNECTVRYDLSDIGKPVSSSTLTRAYDGIYVQTISYGDTITLPAVDTGIETVKFTNWYYVNAKGRKKALKITTIDPTNPIYELIVNNKGESDKVLKADYKGAVTVKYTNEDGTEGSRKNKMGAQTLKFNSVFVTRNLKANRFKTPKKDSKFAYYEIAGNTTQYANKAKVSIVTDIIPYASADGTLSAVAHFLSKGDANMPITYYAFGNEITPVSTSEQVEVPTTVNFGNATINKKKFRNIVPDMTNYPGYKFNGWVNAATGRKVTAITKAQTGELKLVAKFKANTRYTVNIDVEGNLNKTTRSGAVTYAAISTKATLADDVKNNSVYASKTYKAGKKFTLPKVVPVTDAAVFTGWDIDGKLYAAGCKYDMTDYKFVDSPVVEVKAVWEPKDVYYVYSDSMNNELPTDNHFTGRNYGNELTRLEKMGYTFKGWKMVNGDTVSKTVVFFGDGIESVIHLEAVWVLNTADTQ